MESMQCDLLLKPTIADKFYFTNIWTFSCKW